MRRFVIAAVSAVVLGAGSSALAAPNPAGTQQPGTGNPSGNGVSCPSTISSPNGFNSGGFQNAGAVYAGSTGTPSAANGSSNAVSEYDIACYQTSQPH
jgi:hypothetical protein